MAQYPLKTPTRKFAANRFAPESDVEVLHPRRTPGADDEQPRRLARPDQAAEQDGLPGRLDLYPRAAAVRAQQLAQTCEGARTPALAAIAAPLPLTSREREIVTLAAGGLSNRQIAERLVVSVRTVENHLYRACTKLGITDRTELAALLHSD